MKIYQPPTWMTIALFVGALALALLLAGYHILIVPLWAIIAPIVLYALFFRFFIRKCYEFEETTTQIKTKQPAWMVLSYVGLLFATGFSLYGAIFYPDHVPWWTPVGSACLLAVLIRKLKELRAKAFAEDPWDEEELRSQYKVMCRHHFRIMMIVMLAVILCTWMVMQILVKNLR